MSVDVLLNTAGRLASLAKATGTQQGTVAKANGENQEQTEPANIFGALLEKPQNKLSRDSEQKDDTQSDDSDKTEREAAAQTPTQSPAFGVSQNLLVLAAGLTTATGEKQALAGGSTVKPDANMSAFADLGEVASETTSAVATDMPMAEAEPKRDQKSNVQANKKASALIDPKNAQKSENITSSTVSAASNDQPVDNASDSAASTLKSDASIPLADGAEPDRPTTQQPQQSAKSASVVDVKSPAQSTSTAAARIADIQLLSERSFGAVKTLQIRLDPVELGAVTARIRLVADGVEVHLVADKAHGAQALAADRSMIEKALKVAGVADDAKISVTVTERGATAAVQHSSASQSAGHQQAGTQQQGQQSFDMQNGSDNRGNAQGQSQTQFMGGEGRQNGEPGQTERNNTRTRASADANEREASLGLGGHNRGLVV
ncbi:flagellar hook-length control protein FliK [Brucella rhizosphaerae]|uniref:Flagellar hook-length control FliK family protein n=1 Tax=Brucella rhizosphaerae TaxID=571254 RepID=A0A256F0B4_9HYPH|nr:flagellar hook-length control protein FliK [Brucella rhizosphaerae]OYR08287.1 flagellar hook-length control FliK family protein [Brucella rhizosphaerae]